MGLMRQRGGRERERERERKRERESPCLKKEKRADGT